MSLIVKPMQGMFTQDEDLFSKMDPYVIITVGNETKKSRTHQSGGKHPQWSDTFVFSSKATTLKIVAKDEDVISDDLIGEGTLNLQKVYARPNETFNEYVDMMNRGRNVGRVLLNIQYQGPSSAGNTGNFAQIYNNNNYPTQQQLWGQQPAQQQTWGQPQYAWGQPQQQTWGQPQQAWGQPQQGAWGQQQRYPPQNQATGWAQQPPPMQQQQQPMQYGNPYGGMNNNGWGNQAVNPPPPVDPKAIAANLLGVSMNAPSNPNQNTGGDNGWGGFNGW